MISQATHLVHNIRNLVWHPWGCLILIISLGKSYHSLLRTHLQGLFKTVALSYLKNPSQGESKIVILLNHCGIMRIFIG